MRENLTEHEMRGSLHFEFFIKKLSTAQAESLCSIIKRIHGVAEVRRTGNSSNGSFDTFTVSIDGSRLQYFYAIHEDVIAHAHSFQSRIT